MKDSTFESKAYGKRVNKVISIEGRVQFDLLPVSFCLFVCVCVCVCVYLVPTGEVAHPAVTSMGTWCKLEKQMLSCPYLYIAIVGPGGTSGAHTFTCETWYSLLQVTSPAPGGHACADS